jgi:hypothetical protein
MAHSHVHVNGECYPSVTYITGSKPKPWLDKWRKKHGERLCDRKAKLANVVGSAFHSFVDSYIHGSIMSFPCRRLTGMITSFLTWFTDQTYEPIVSELKVYSKKYKYQGTLDAIGKLNGELVLIDWKTSSGIYSDMGLQLVAYARAYKERFGIDIKTGYIILVSKDKPHHKVSVRRFDLNNKLFRQFLKLRRELPEYECDGKNVINIDD